MTYPTRITTRTPIATVLAGELASGATVLTRTNEPITVDRVARPCRAIVRLTDDRGRIAELPAGAPVRVYAC